MDAEELDELMKRLRTTPLYYGYGEASSLPEDAADALTALSAEVERLRGYLKDFAVGGHVMGATLEETYERMTTKARAALEGKSNG